MIFLLIWILALIVGVITTIINPALRSIQSISFNLLFYQITITITLSGFVSFVGHVFKSDIIAIKNNWPKGNLFQKELGFSQLGWTFAGLLSLWYNNSKLWIPIIIIFSTMYIGAAIIHIFDIKKNKNHIKGNPFIILVDILIPVTIIILSILAKIW